MPSASQESSPLTFDLKEELLAKIEAARSSLDMATNSEVIRHAIETDDPVLRYQVSWGGRELVLGRTQLSDEAWVELGTIADIDEYIAAFRDAFGLDMTT